MNLLRSLFIYLAILAAAALLGFYFTMSVSIMPGFDQTVPYAAMQANQDIGRATQESAFFVALLGTPLFLIAALVVSWRNSRQRVWLLIAIVAWVGMMGVTVLGNVPLNQLLDGMTISSDTAGLKEAWQAYSAPWQFWNWFRTLLSAISLLATVRSLTIQH